MTTSGASGRDPDGTLLAEQTPDGREFYYYFDGLGSVIGLIDTTGTNAATYTYDPYGGHATVGAGAYPDTTVAEANPYRYAGGYRDQATGLYKFGARYYDPTLGRWTQPDPQRRLLDLKQGNLYAYAGDAPSDFTDPTGRNLFSTVEALVEGASETFFGFGMTYSALAGVGIVADLSTAGVVAAALTGAGIGFAGLLNLGLGAYEVYELAS